MTEIDYGAPDALAPAPHPFAVYGTLRQGFGNSRLWQGHGEVIARGKVAGFKMVVSNEHASFPYAIEADGFEIVVEVMRPNAAAHTMLARRLDQLEGYPGHYTRSVVDVAIGGLPLKCWMYHAGARLAENLRTRGRTVASGDWEQFVLAQEPAPDVFTLDWDDEDGDGWNW